VGRSISTIFFDFGGTLATIPTAINRPWKVWVEVARRFDVTLSETLVQHAIEATNEELRSQIYGYLGRTGEYWQLFDNSVMSRLRIRDKREQIGRAVDAVFSDPTNRELYPDSRPVLDHLRAEGYHLGLISNNNDILPKVLEHLGLSDLLETVTFSQEVGAEKPAPEIFTTALTRAHSTPDEAVHIGDSIRADVEGAQKSGIQSIWINRDGRPGAVDSPMITTLNELPAVLDLIAHDSTARG